MSQDTCQLRISFQIEDFGLGMFKVAVANGTKNGLKANFVDFAQVLSNFAPPVLAKMGTGPSLSASVKQNIHVVHDFDVDFSWEAAKHSDYDMQIWERRNRMIDLRRRRF